MQIIVGADVVSIEKSGNGSAGEKNARYDKTEVLGTINGNEVSGIFGSYTSKIDENTDFNYEFCAGLCDKEGLEPEKVAIEEVLEETGYAVPSVNYITSSFTGLGFSANRQSVFYAIIDESMKKGQGGGVDDECIELVFIARKDIYEFLYDESKPKGAGALFGLLWFMSNVAPKL